MQILPDHSPNPITPQETPTLDLNSDILNELMGDVSQIQEEANRAQQNINQTTHEMVGLLSDMDVPANETYMPAYVRITNKMGETKEIEALFNKSSKTIHLPDSISQEDREDAENEINKNGITIGTEKFAKVKIGHDVNATKLSNFFVAYRTFNAAQTALKELQQLADAKKKEDDRRIQEELQQNQANQDRKAAQLLRDAQAAPQAKRPATESDDKQLERRKQKTTDAHVVHDTAVQEEHIRENRREVKQQRKDLKDHVVKLQQKNEESRTQESFETSSKVKTILSDTLTRNGVTQEKLTAHHTITKIDPTTMRPVTITTALLHNQVIYEVK